MGVVETEAKSVTHMQPWHEELCVSFTPSEQHSARSDVSSLSAAATECSYLCLSKTQKLKNEPNSGWKWICILFESNHRFKESLHSLYLCLSMYCLSVNRNKQQQKPAPRTCSITRTPGVQSVHYMLYAVCSSVRVFCVMIDKVSKRWCTSHTVWLLTCLTRWATQTAAAHVRRVRAGMITCEGWQCVWRLAWHQLALCRQRLSSHAKASVTQINGTGDSSDWEIRICSAMKTQQQQQTEGQEAAYQSILCHGRLKFPIVEYEVTGVCVVCVCLCGGQLLRFLQRCTLPITVKIDCIIIDTWKMKDDLAQSR